MIHWKDTTSYARDERGKVEPRSWTATTVEPRPIEITVTRKFGLEGWYLFLRGPLWMHEVRLPDDLERAKDRAHALVRRELGRLLADVEGMGQ